MGRPGTRDEYSACVGEELVRESAYDFLLFALPDNDFHSHRHGPEAQTESIAKADVNFARLVEAGGGLDAFLRDHAVILTADHAQTAVEHGLPLAEALAEDWRVLEPNAERPEEAEIAVSPTSRAGAVYILGNGPGHAEAHERVTAKLRELAGVDLVTWLADGRRQARWCAPASGSALTPEGAEAVVSSNGQELRFRPGGRHRDRRGAEWDLRGRFGAAGGRGLGGRFDGERYPDALARLWSALTSPHAGDVLISAADGYECVDWGGVSHTGGGSHGALSREDSLAPLLFVGCGPRRPRRNPQWALRDLAPVILGHFGVGRRRWWTWGGHVVSPVQTAKRIGRGTMRSENWVQLFQFGLVGASGYIVNLTAFAILTGSGLFFREERRPRRSLHPRGGARLLRRGHQQLPLEQALDLRRQARPRRLPGGAILHRQHARAGDQPDRARAADPGRRRRRAARPGDRGRLRDAVQLHRQQDVDVRVAAAI